MLALERAVRHLRLHPVQAVVVSAIVLFSMLTIGFGRGGISGASIGEWNRIMPDKTDGYRGLQLGESLPIRSDEWAVSLPFVLAQCRSEQFFPRVNSHINGGMDMFVETPCAPVWDWTALGQFHNWGFFLFGESHGLAWSWWTRYLLLPMFAFLFFLKWCKDDMLLSGVGAAAVTLGAPTQWWDTTVPYHLAYFFSTLVFLRQIFLVRGFVAAALSSLALMVSLSSYCFVMYPPFSLLLFPVLVLLAVYEVWSAERPLSKARMALAALALVGVVAELAYFFSVHDDTLGIVGASSYPGARFIRGGSFRFLCRRALLDWMSCYSPFVARLPKINPCQAAEYIGMSVPFFCGVTWAVYRRRVDVAIAALAVFAAILLAWCAFPWPPFLARWTGLFLIPVARASVVSGFVLLLCAIRWVALSSRDMDALSAPRWFVAVAVGVLVALRALAFFAADDIWRWFCSSWTKLGMLFVVATLTISASWSLLRGRRILFAVSLLVFSALTGCFVHPLVEGVSPIYDKVLSRVVMEIDGKNPGVWMSNDRVVAQLPVALGLKAYAGTQQYCDVHFWETVDPDKKFVDVWNRYGHRRIENFYGHGDPDNRRATDAIYFSLDEDKVRRLGIRYVIWRGEPLRLAWLRNIASVKSDHVYEVRPRKKMRRRKRLRQEGKLREHDYPEADEF